METQERHYAVEHLTGTEARLLKSVERLSPEQWQFKESPDRWSIAEIVEHCVLIEDGLLKLVRRTLAEPPDLEKKAAAAAKRGQPDGSREAAARKLDSPVAFLPRGKWTEPGELVAELQRARRATLEFANVTDAELHDHFFPHFAMGDLDCYQWVLLLSHHFVRHSKQIEAVKAHEGFPR